MNPPRIAYICADPGVPVFGRKGCSIHVQEVIRALRRRGMVVQLFAARCDGPPPADLRDVVTHALPCPRDGDPAERERACKRANTTLVQLLAAAGPFDFVYERYSLWSHLGMRYAADCGIPGLLEVNAPLIEEQSTHRSLANLATAERIARCVFKEAAAIIAVSDSVADWLRAKDAASRAIHVIPNGVDPLRFPPGLRPALHLGGKGRTFTIGFVGTLKPWHGVPVLINAFARLRQHSPEARLLIVGDGPERAALAERVRSLHLESFVHFAGAVAAEKIPGLLAAMDVAVAPYPPLDNFYFSPLKVYEYMAAGRPVVASRIGQLTQLIRHGENGLLCEPGDGKDLAAQLGRLRGDAGLRAQLGAAARRTILDGHTWDHVAGRILTLAGSCRGDRIPTGKFTPTFVPETTSLKPVSTIP